MENKILDKEITIYNSDYNAYKEYYKDAKKIRDKSGKKAKTAVSKVKGLGKSVKNKIKNRIKKHKTIPANLLKKVEKASVSTYSKLVDYNNNVNFAADAKTKNGYEAKSLKNLKGQYDYLIKIAKLEGDTTEQKRLQAEFEEKTAESYKTMYDNIKTEYDNQTRLNDAQISTVQAQIATLEAAGKSASKEIYEDMMKVSGDTMEKLIKERAELEEAGKKFEYGSDEWYEWRNDLLSIDQRMESCTQNTIEFQKAVNELDLKKFSLISAQIESANGQIDFLIDTLSHKDLTSKDASGLTDEGFTTLSLWLDKMENNNKTIKNARDAMAEYMKQVEAGTTGDDFETQNQKLQEWVETIRDAKLADEELKDSIVDLVEEAFNVQLDVLNELIEKRKKALQTEKDLYDYQRKVAGQTKNIAALEKQIAALSGDKSEEARAKLQKLNVELDEARDELKETEYDKWISDQEDMLDNLTDEMEDFFENILCDTNGLIEAVVKAVNENGSVMVNTLENLGLGDSHSFDTKDNINGTSTSDYKDYGGNDYSLTYGGATGTNANNAFDTSLKDVSASGLKGLVDKFRESVERVPHTIEQNTLPSAGDIGRTTDRANASIIESRPGGNSNMKGIRESQIKGSLNKRKALKNQSTSYINKYTTGEYGNALNQYLANKDGKVYTSWADMKELGGILGVKVTGDKITSKEAKKIRDELKNAGFSQGGIVSAINKVVKENGDDGIATVKNGEAVLTPKQTKAIEELPERFTRIEPELTKEQMEYLRGAIGLTQTATEMMDSMTKAARTMEINNNKNVQTREVNIGDVNIHMDGSNVVDKESFRKTLRDYEVRSDIEQIALG